MGRGEKDGDRITKIRGENQGGKEIGSVTLRMNYCPAVLLAVQSSSFEEVCVKAA